MNGTIDSRRRAVIGIAAASGAVAAGLLPGCGGSGGSGSAGGSEMGATSAPPATTPPPAASAPTNEAPSPALPVANPDPVQAIPIRTGLASPWSFVFLPDGRVLVTEKGGTLRYLALDGSAPSAPLAGVPAVATAGQGGLLDVALGPTFDSDRRIYFTYSEPVAGGAARAAVACAVLGTSALTDLEVIYRQAPATTSTIHFGARLVFDRSGLLFVTLGERGDGAQAQRMQVSLGKVIRIRADGTVPPDNPAAMPDGAATGRSGDDGPAHPAFREAGALPELWTFGHRNPQGAALHPVTGELWISEHGPRGGDEINRIRRGRNYGWPRITYGRDYGTGEPFGDGTTAADVEPPLAHWAPVSVAPAGMLFYTGDKLPAGWQDALLVGTLAGASLVRYALAGDTIASGMVHLSALRQRIRTIRQGPDGFPYFITDGGGLYRLAPR
ncbi:MAG: PQQ-dependent sugar dehydrogenase [Lautropia sp.]